MDTPNERDTVWTSRLEPTAAGEDVTHRGVPAKRGWFGELGYL